MKKDHYLYYFMVLSYSLSEVLFGVCYILILNKVGLSASNITLFILCMQNFVGLVEKK